MHGATDDPHHTLGVSPEATAEQITAAYRQLVRQEHPDLHPHDSAAERAARHQRVAAITAAYRMLNDPAELQRWQRLQERRRPDAAGDQPGRRGVHFTAANPRAGGGIEPAPGDPDFDYRRRAPSEFDVDDRPGGVPWSARPRRRSRWRRR
ncbi:DnaJ domain-containing protein [Egicoccus sp. AB-alg2]|uniref:J domain-containing protein n=1 Tax=Egicoccus sp. AB-alg2 TaxID=3242693 RepID=UPI00359DE128